MSGATAVPSVLQCGSSLPCCSGPCRINSEWTRSFSSPLAWVHRQQSISPPLPSPLRLSASIGTSICLPVHILWQNRGRNSDAHFLSLTLFSPNSFLTQWAGVRDTTGRIPAWLVAQQAIEREISFFLGEVEENWIRALSDGRRKIYPRGWTMPSFRGL